MKTYTIIAGVNGTGKSSLSGMLKDERNDLGMIVDVDKITVEHQCGAIQAGKIAVAKMEEALANGDSFTQETTLSGVRTERFVREAKEQGYAVRLYYIGLNSAEESIKRIQNRVAKGGHNIDNADVSRRFNKRFDDLVKILPYCDDVRLYDNENGFEVIGEYRNGRITVKGDAKPEWLLSLIDKVTTE
ncbi:MAG: zeta toxin family protein [Oscillospiraceae bacterium]|nr:zeta toxin family protein [Oscillospiraceae bacterium]